MGGTGMKAGQPTKYIKDFHPHNFIEQSKKGSTLAQIALAWDVDRDTVHEWKKVHKEFSEAVKKGRQFAEAWYMNLGRLAMLGARDEKGKAIQVNLGFFCWLTKNMFHWSDKMEQKTENVGISETQVIILPDNGRSLRTPAKSKKLT